MLTKNPEETKQHHAYQQIASVIGIEAAEKLVQEFGGEAIYFPRVEWTNPGAIDPSDLPPAYQNLTRIVGAASALKLAREFSGESLYLPMQTIPAATLHAARDKSIFEKACSGQYSIRALSKEYHLGSRRIYEIIRAAKSEKTSSNG